ncbi:MAG: helix-turn-helix domain-containing protein [Xenophilus sp.]
MDSLTAPVPFQHMSSSRHHDLMAGSSAFSPADVSSRAAMARHALFSEGRVLSGLISSEVLDSWRRCQMAGMKPEAKPVFAPVLRHKISYLEGRDQALLGVASGLFEELQASLARSHCKVMLTDRHGVLLRTTPHDAADSALLKSACRPGVDLSEPLVGTNAPALTARAGVSCQIDTGEHFYDMLRSIRCVAAPIRDRRGTVVGVLDLTVENRPFGFNAAWLVGSYASAIENKLRVAQTRQQVLLRMQLSPALLDSPMAGLMAVDGSGRVGWMNDQAEALTGAHTRREGTRHCEPVLGIGLEQVLTLCAARRPQPLLLPNGLTVWLAAHFRQRGGAAGSEPDVADSGPPGPADAGMDGADAVIHEKPLAAAEGHTLAQLNRQLIEHTLVLCGGNVSRAARLLKVSRGLLYRHLREESGAPR